MHAILVATLAVAALQGAPQIDGERIAFSRLTDGFWQIWTIRPDGEGETRWTSGKSDKRHPEWCSTGSFLVYTDTHGALFRIDAPGADPVRQLADQSPISEPSLSVDDRIAYLHVRKSPAYLAEVWTSRLDGGDLRLVTQQPMRQLEPAWSPDGRHLAVSQFDQAQKIFSLAVMAADGSATRTLVAGSDRIVGPSWSPDGRKLAYALYREDDHDLWMVGDDGRPPQRLTHGAGLDMSPVFSADGQELAFVSRRSGSLQLWKLSLPGDPPTRLTRGDAPCRDPAWFARRRAAGPQLFSVSLSQPHFDLRAQSAIVVRFSLDRSAEASLEILDDGGGVVRRVRSDRELAAGAHEIAWDGRYDDGAPARDGLHLARLIARDALGRTEWEPSHETGGTEISLLDSRLDAEGRRIHFTMSEPGCVRLRVGLDDGPMLATLLDWKPVAKGPVAVGYPGLLPEPWGDFWAREDRAAWAVGYSLPVNAVVVEGGSAPERSGRPTLHQRTDRVLSPHALHARELCRDPAVSASLAGELPRDESGRPIVRDELTLIVDAASVAERAVFEHSRFEVVLFVDGQFLMEDEDSVLPFHFTLDVRDYPPGVHAFLVNVDAYGNHGGAAFVPFRVGGKGTR
jgi:hypothetical protein